MAPDTEAHRNYETFLEMLPELAQTHPGQTALLHDRQLIAVFDDGYEARSVGKRRYGRGRFSVQRITVRPVDLGWFSHVSG